MATVEPFPGLLYNPAHIRLGGVLAPPYDVISEERREQLYARDLRNIVRIDYGKPFDDDVAGVNDVYTRARGHLDAWLTLGILLQPSRPRYIISAHEFTMPDGSPRRRMGLFATVAARPWETAELRPHERTLRGPKVDRLALLRATATQTSAVFGLWDNAPGLDTVFATASGAPALLGGRAEGEFGDEKHLVWPVDDPDQTRAITAALSGARLYVADGHHRYETAVAYAQERRAAEPGAPPDAAFERCLVYLCAADDPGMAVLPTHRLVSPRSGLPRTVAELETLLGPGASVVAVESLDEAVRAAGLRRATHHAFGIAMAEGYALVALRREAAASPRDSLDVVVLESLLLGRLGVDRAAISEGALTYSRSVDEVETRVADGRAGMGITVNPATVAETMAVADAAEVMPQKSTYFYPKVPTGIVLAPV